jgi:RNA polymerase sigma factor (sigma-70 family)
MMEPFPGFQRDTPLMNPFAPVSTPAAAQAQRFDALLRPHVARLYRQAYRYTGRREDAEDLVQDLLTKLYPRTDELAGIDDLAPWLTRSLYHAFVDGLRRRSRTVEVSAVPDDGVLDTVIDPWANQHADVERLEQRQALADALDQLKPDHRAVVVLHLVEGYPLPELERLLDVQLGTLKSRLHRAKAQLRATLEKAHAGSMEPKPANERVNGHEL